MRLPLLPPSAIRTHYVVLAHVTIIGRIVGSDQIVKYRVHQIVIGPRQNPFHVKRDISRKLKDLRRLERLRMGRHVAEEADLEQAQESLARSSPGIGML